MNKKALILGATGLIGKHLLNLLLKEDVYNNVYVISRRPISVEHPKLIQVVGELEDLTLYSQYFQVDDIFCCLGTTIKKAGSKENFRKVDYQMPVLAAKMGIKYGVKQYLVVSAMGANQKSRYFYNRVKGEMEAALSRFPYKGLFIFRPSLLLGNRDEIRPGEKFAEIISKPLGPFLHGRFEKYRPIQAKAVAQCMLKMAFSNESGIKIIESDILQKIQK